MSDSIQPAPTVSRIERIVPILSVKSISTSVKYYVEALGYAVSFEMEGFAGVSRDGHDIYLCSDGQGQPGTWVWVGVEDVDAVHEELQARGARIVHGPRNFPWACELRVTDPDGHMLRFGAEPREGQPYDSWMR